MRNYFVTNIFYLKKHNFKKASINFPALNSNKRLYKT